MLAVAVLSLGAAPAGGRSTIREQDLREWLTYIASDELAGRATYSAGLGLAASYIADHLQAWGVRPAGDAGTYLQTVRVLGIKSVNRSTLTVTVGGEQRVFKDGEGVVFPKNVGGKRRITLDHVAFAGYGLDAPEAGFEPYRGRDVTGAAVIWLGAAGPTGAEPFKRLLAGRSRHATERRRAAAAIGPDQRVTGGTPAPAVDSSSSSQIPPADFVTVQDVDRPVPPNVTGSDELFALLFSRAPVQYDELKRLADAREPLPSFRLDGVTLTFDLDADYEVVRTQLSHNVVGMVPGGDLQLRNSYVAFGAHYDHVGYAEGELADGARRIGAPGRVSDSALEDRIWNGADDDGSGVVSLMAVARAFALGPPPRRSVLFVWHTGEERGLLGSRYFADHPTVPLDRIVAQLNLDMVGRNRDDNPKEADTVYLVGSDRISTELDAIDRQANASLPRPLTLDYELNDPGDLEQFYYRSDHYSYAAKGIPIIFFTTGLHADYHANTDEVSKIEFQKMVRIAQLVYETGVRLANLDHQPARDNKGPQTGKHGAALAPGR